MTLIAVPWIEMLCSSLAVSIDRFTVKEGDMKTEFCESHIYFCKNCLLHLIELARPGSPGSGLGNLTRISQALLSNKTGYLAALYFIHPGF